jgi:spermidine synthase
MGLTLPLLGASSIVRGVGVGARVSALYAANTAGALTGVLGAGYELIGSIGMRRTYLVAAAVNGLVGLGALALSRGDDRALAPASSPTPAPAPILDEVSRRTRRQVAIVIAVSGAISLALEIVWFRILLQFLPATTYAFTTMLATVLGGIALGGAIGARILSRPRDFHLTLARVTLWTGIAVVGCFIFLTWSYRAGWRTSATIQACAAAILPAATLMGVAFPIALRLGALSAGMEPTNGRAVTQGIGRLYALNVAGAIAGALAGGFVLLPLLGSRFSLVLLASLYVGSALYLVLSHERRRAIFARLAVPVAVFGVAAAFVPDPFTAAIGRRYGVADPNGWRDEGAQTAVTVVTHNAHRTMFIDGMHQADDAPGMVGLHRIIGHLPMLLHHAPSRALVVGLGGGATPGAISLHPGVFVDIIELSPSVRRAAAEFAHINYDVLRRPNVRVRMDDGRNFLRLTDQRFDVITADVMQPTTAGAGNLYSREYFTLVRHALRPGGLVLQWIGDRPTEHYKALIRTFLDVFPESTLWYHGNMLVGSLEPLHVDLAAVADRFRPERVRQSLSTAGLQDAGALRQWYTAGPDELRRFVGQGDLLTDDRPLLEYHRSFSGGGAPGKPDFRALGADVGDVFGGA